MEINNSTLSMIPDNSTTMRDFGAQLKRARLEKDLSLEDAAGELFILKRHLQALEEEDFSELPQAAFARGFVVNYAKYLGLDPHSLVAGFDMAYPDHLRKESAKDIRSPLRPMGTLQREGKRSWRINPLLIIGLILLVVFGVFLWRTINNAQEENKVEQNSAIRDEQLSSSDQAAGAYIAPANSGMTTGTNMTSTNMPAQSSTGSAISMDNQNASAVNGEGSTLEFWVQGNTNISVIDATGISLLNGVQSRGGYKIVGIPPFKVQIDNVDRVSLDLNQEKVRLADYAQNNKANFSLAP